MGVALPAIQDDLGMSPASLQWVMSAYALGYGGFLLLGGRAADLLGRRRTFLAAVVVFAVVSVAGAIAPSGGLLIVARLVKGVAAGFLAPAALSLITTNWPEGPERDRALGWYATAGACGFVGGLVLGGVLTEVSWRLVFALPVPIAVAALIAGSRLLPPDPPRTERGGRCRGHLWRRPVPSSPSVLPVMVLNGLGTAATFPALNMSAVTGVPDRDQGLAGALLNTSMQIGGAVVLAVVTAVADAGQRANATDPLAGYVPAIAVIVGGVLAGLAATTLIRNAGAHIPPTTAASRGGIEEGQNHDDTHS